MKINMTKKLLLSSSIAMAMSQISAAPTARIIGGSQATAGSYPWVVSLKDGGGEHFCGGSLIDKQWVMTASHCVEGETASGMSVVIGEFNTVGNDAGEQKREVTQIIMHPEYDQGASTNNDIALLKLKSPVSNKTVTPIVPSIMKDIKAGSILTVMGWGNQSTTGEEFPNRLFQVEVPLVTNQQCATDYAVNNTTITENMVCAGFKQGGKDSCQGDSGGPLVYQIDGTWQQVGIVSFGEGCALPDFPGVYARVEKYNDWINQKIGASGSPTTTPSTPEPEVSEPESPQVPTNSDSSEINLASLDLPAELDLIARDGNPENSLIEIQNTTNQTLNLVDISVNQAEFEIKSNNCVTSLKPNETCEVTLTFNPSQNGEDAEGDLIIDLEDGTNLNVALFGSNLQAISDNYPVDDSQFDDEPFVNDDDDYAFYNDDIEWYLDDDTWSQYDDGFSMDSSELDLNDFATLSAEIEGEGEFQFDFDFENDFDENYCSYYVDGKLVRTLRGSNRGTSHHVTKLTKGKHEIMWVYKKKSENSGTLKIKNIKLVKKEQANINAPATLPTPVNSLSDVSTPVSTDSSAQTSDNTTASSSTRSGGGSTGILLLSGLFLLLARTRKLFIKR